MQIRKKKDKQITIYFDKEDQYYVDIDLDLEADNHLDFPEPNFNDIAVTVSRIDDDAIEDYREEREERDRTTTSLVEQLKRNSKEIDVEETTEAWDGSEIKTTGKGMNMREFLKKHNL